jgi:hypothetical protein
MNINPLREFSVIEGGLRHTSSPLLGGPPVGTSSVPAVAATERARRRAIACRPTDALEPWRVEVGTGLRQLAARATAAGLALDTAAAVVIERALVTRERALDPDVLLDLDRRAQLSRPGIGLCAATAAYLRELGNVANDSVALRARTVVIALPARLNDRIRSPERLPELMDPAALSAALAWERAAVANGWTLTEWALAQLLELRF